MLVALSRSESPLPWNQLGAFHIFPATRSMQKRPSAFHSSTTESSSDIRGPRLVFFWRYRVSQHACLPQTVHGLLRPTTNFHFQTRQHCKHACWTTSTFVACNATNSLASVHCCVTESNSGFFPYLSGTQSVSFPRAVTEMTQHNGLGQRKLPLSVLFRESHCIITFTSV